MSWRVFNPDLEADRRKVAIEPIDRGEQVLVYFLRQDLHGEFAKGPGFPI